MPNESMRLSRRIGPASFIGAILFVATLSAARAETIYYAVAHGQNFENETWHAGDLKTFNAHRPENVFDLYTFHSLSDGTAKVIREMSTPSGDWFLNLTYFYAKDGRLTKIDFDYRTFLGVCSCGETGAVRCRRRYLVDRSGHLRKESELVTRLDSGNAVDWTFPEPKVRHWAKLSELPIRPQ
jgi:hypothetical protein